MNFVKRLLREMGNQTKTVLTEKEKIDIKSQCYEKIINGARTIVGKRVCILNLYAKTAKKNVLVKNVRKPTVTELSSYSETIFIIEYAECTEHNGLMEDPSKKEEYYCTAKTEIFVAI